MHQEKGGNQLPVNVPARNGEYEVKDVITNQNILTLVRKTGPMARKRELRAMLEKQDEGYEDDAFEGTPFRNRKSLLKVDIFSSFCRSAAVKNVSSDDIMR